MRGVRIGYLLRWSAPRFRRIDARNVVADEIEAHLIQRAGFARAEEERALRPRAERAAVAERHSRGGDRGREELERKHPRKRAVGVRVERRRSAPAVEARTPRVVRPGLDAIQLVVALGPVLGLPQIPGLGIEVEAEGVAQAEGEDQARERVVARHASARRHPKDLAADVVEILSRRLIHPAVADHRVQHAVGSEEDASAVVIRAGRRGGPEDDLRMTPPTAVVSQPHDLVLKRV
jgi:hypothetical protein